MAIQKYFEGSGRMELSAVLQQKQSEKKRKKKREVPTPDPRAQPKKSDITAALMDAGIRKGGVSSEQVVVLMEEECKIDVEKSREVLGRRSKGCCSVM